MPGAINGSSYRALLFASGGTGSLSWSITHGSLPTGLSLDTASGVITGVPTKNGKSKFTVQVSDSSMPSPEVRSASLTLVVGAPPQLSVATTALPDGTAGSSFAESLIATGGSPPYAWSITSGNLPPGVSLDSSGLISGTPTAPGTYSFVAQVTDSQSPTPQTTSVSLSLTIDTPSPVAIATTAVSSGTQGLYYTEALDVQGGVAPYAWSIASGALPEGLTLNPVTGEIYGQPTSYRTYSFSVEVSDRTTPTAETARQSYTLKITPAAPFVVSANSLPGGTQGQYYSQSLGISGGVFPYSVNVSSGTLPEGLTLDQYGNLYGELTSASTETFTITVRDGSTPTAQTASVQYTIDVTPAPPLELSSSLGSLVLGQYGDQQLGVTGGVPGFTWTVLKSKLPAGLSFSGGQIYGTPTKLGKGTIAVKVTDSATPTTQSVTKTITVSVVKPAKLKVVTKTLPTAIAGSYYQQQINITGGSPGFTWTLASGSLPEGMYLSGATIYGYPAAAGSYSFSVSVADSGQPVQQTATKAFKLKVKVK
jgi:hypothetical protein